MGCFGSKAKKEPTNESPRRSNTNDSGKRDGVNDDIKSGGSPDKAQASDDDTIIRTPIEDTYTFGREIGKGGFSVVMEATNKRTGEKVAIKRIRKDQVEGDDINLLLREVKIMRRLDHPNILKLYEVYESDEEFFLVMELVPGKELFDKIVDKGQYSEREAANIVRQIVSAVAYLHDQGIAHRDLKPENLLTSGDGDNEIVKIADFGFSKNFGEDKLKTSCGSPGYVAPEVLTNEDYDNSVDMWSVGVIIYILLCGYPPFYADNAPALFKKIMEVKYDFDDPSWENVSREAKELISSLLVKDPQKRLTAKQVLEHEWLKRR
jgi:calcium/calmodulin-dependent protein kinase I